MKIYRGLTKDEAIPVYIDPNDLSCKDRIVDQTLEEMFGKNDGEYFVINSMLRTDNERQIFRVMYIEDKDNVKHTIYFKYIKAKSA